VVPAAAGNTSAGGNTGGTGGNNPAAGQNAAASVSGTTWTGTENLQGFGKLTFQFQASGAATMTDANTSVQGSWSQNGNQVTISFTSCVYTGTINGRVLSGNARSNIGQVWTFSVTKG